MKQTVFICAGVVTRQTHSIVVTLPPPPCPGRTASQGTMHYTPVHLLGYHTTGPASAHFSQVRMTPADPAETLLVPGLGIPAEGVPAAALTVHSVWREVAML